MPNTDYIQNSEHLARARGYHVAAVAMLEQGFTTEAARKDAIDYLNRAYDVLVKQGLHYALWSQRTRTNDNWVWDNDTAKELDHNHNVPDLHVWNGNKHGKLYAAYPEQVRIANILRSDRELVKAATLIAKSKSRTRALAEARQAVAKTCQICGRPILAERGKIAHHGYQRPGMGLQTSSCDGAMHLPFEVSRDRLGAHLKGMKVQLINLHTRRGDVVEEKAPIAVEYFTGQYRGKERVMTTIFVTRETYAALYAEHKPKAYHVSALPKTFDEIKNEEIRQIDSRIKHTQEYIKMQQGRYDGWKAVV